MGIEGSILRGWTEVEFVNAELLGKMVEMGRDGDLDGLASLVVILLVE